MTKNKAALYPIVTSCAYMIVGMSVGFTVALKMIWPNLGEFAFLSFGRIRMVHTNIILFGWLLQANMGLLFYVFPKLLNTKLYSQKLAMVTWGVYNIAVAGGLIGLLMGHNKSLEYAEIAPPFDYMIALSWVLFGANLIATLAKRKVKHFYVTIWYVVGCIIWTAFVYITGNMITQIPGVTGINQANLTWFYVHNAVGLIFTPLGVALAYYLIPKELNTPLYSHKLSLVGFWVIAFTYVWTGAHHMLLGPISYWLQTVAILFSWSLIIPVVAVVTNFIGTFKAAPKKARFNGGCTKFLYAATIFYLLTCLQGPFQAIRTVNLVVSKTDWVVGHAHMALLGTFSFIAFAGIYHVLPKILGRELFSQKLANLHFWLTFLGAVPFFAVLWVSGVIQGLMWLDLETTFIESLRLMKPYHLLRWITGSIIIIGQIIFLYNIWETLFGKPKPVEADKPIGAEPAAQGAQS